MTFPSSEQAEAMRIALDMACKEPGLSESDEASRARVSSAITTLARAGQKDAEQLKTYAVHRFRSLGRSQRIAAEFLPLWRTGTRWG